MSAPTTNQQAITNFYTAFQNKDYAGMQACYADEVHFTDAAFDLKGKRAKAMWHMLVLNGKDMTIAFSDVKADEKAGSAKWVATYVLSLTGNKVVNRIDANFEFKDGKIVRHQDRFDFWKWASQAFGFKGLLLGWTPFFQKKVQATVNERLNAFIAKNPQYQ